MENKIRFVDTQQALEFSGLAEQKAVHLKAVAEKLRGGLSLAQSHYTTLDESDRQTAEVSDRQVLEMQWQAEQRAAHQVVNAALLQTVLSWQQKHNVAAILSKENALAVADAVDITALITSELRTTKLAFGNLPEINIQPANERKIDIGADE